MANELSEISRQYSVKAKSYCKCCECIPAACVYWFFGGLNVILFILGIIVVIGAVSMGNDTWLQDMIKEAGISFANGVEMSEKMYKGIKDVFIVVGVTFIVYGLSGGLVLYAKKCCCSCAYGFMTGLLFIFALIIAVPVFALWGMETKTVDEFCKNDFNALPFNFGEYFKKNPDMSATKLDILLNGPSKIMCSKACPCAPIDKTKWSMQWQAKMAAPNALAKLSKKQRTWDFTGKIKTLKECVAYLGREDADASMVSQALNAVNNKEADKFFDDPSMKNIDSDLTRPQDDRKNKNKKQKQLEKLVNGKYMKIYNILETKWDCQAVCTPSPFWMTQDISKGPPTEGCVYRMKKELDESAKGWGGCFIGFLLYILCLMCWSCTTYQLSEEAQAVNAFGNAVEKNFS